MKRVLSVILVCFALLLLFPDRSFAQDSAAELEAIEESEEVFLVEQDEGVADEEEEYVLPYPGILPDHPLYSLKRIRDYVLEILISDQHKKVEYYILQGDKRLNMALFLHDAEKYDYIPDVLLEAEEYVRKAQDQLQKLTTEDAQISQGLRDLVRRSSEEHVKHLTMFKESTSDAVRASAEKAAQIYE